MSYRRIASLITKLALILLIGIAYGEDYMGSGYTRSSDSSIGVDEWINGMNQWLDGPVSNIPGNSSYPSPNDLAPFNPMGSSFKSYPPTNGVTAGREMLSIPVKFNITQEMPSNVYYGAGHELPFFQYVSIMPFETNDLWIRGATNWTRHFITSVGTKLRLIANVSGGGIATFYELIQTDQIILKNKTYSLYEGYNSMDFVADQVGKHMIYFVADNQPSNVVIVDVTGQAPSIQYQTYPGTVEGQISSTTPQISATIGDTTVIIQSQGMNGYQVYVDEVYVGTEGMVDDPLDGMFSFRVVGNQNHDIRVYDGQFNYLKRMYFSKGVQKIINVEPGTSAYI
jgi:hypothetical protein